MSVSHTNPDVTPAVARISRPSFAPLSRARTASVSTTSFSLEYCAAVAYEPSPCAARNASAPKNLRLATSGTINGLLQLSHATRTKAPGTFQWWDQLTFGVYLDTVSGRSGMLPKHHLDTVSDREHQQSAAQ